MCEKLCLSSFYDAKTSLCLLQVDNLIWAFAKSNYAVNETNEVMIL